MNYKKYDNYIVSYSLLRLLIGFLGMLLPFVVILGSFFQDNHWILDSISEYYYTNMRDFFVGVLSTVGFLLITYKGYDSYDNRITSLSGISAFGIAIFPMDNNPGTFSQTGLFLLEANISNYFHFIFSASFLLLLAYSSYSLFTKSNKQGSMPTKEKLIRNRIYKTCGFLIFISVVGILLLVLFPKLVFKPIKPILLLETTALISFGISWIIKGEAIFRDKTPDSI